MRCCLWKLSLLCLSQVEIVQLFAHFQNRKEETHVGSIILILFFLVFFHFIFIAKLSPFTQNNNILSFLRNFSMKYEFMVSMMKNWVCFMSFDDFFFFFFF